MKHDIPALIQLNPGDNVAMAGSGIPAGTRIEAFDLLVREDIPKAHKVALRDIAAGEAVYKYGEFIGSAARSIGRGCHVHAHNLEVAQNSRSYTCSARPGDAVRQAAGGPAVFDGFVRPDGRVGTRNYIGILSTVNCSASICHFIADRAEKDLTEKLGSIDGIVGLGHGAGCCMTVGGQGLEILQRTLAGFARHPNFGGILVIGLGCEVNRISDFFNAMNLTGGPQLKSLDIQDAGGTERTLSRAMGMIRDMLPTAASCRRTEVPASRLTLGLECGGSDAYSGITANPALGRAADLLVRDGGTVILSETPEIYGAEHLLIQRAVTCDVADKLVEKIRWWEAYTEKHGARINNNPTPGNKDGGISTILEKSLGAVAKAGTSPLVDVYSYAQPVTARGMVFMDTPGYDIVSITGMIAGGANMIGFTTGRGTVVGFKPVPCLKLASNTPMFEWMKCDMDIDCGPVIDQGVSLDDMGRQIYEAILAAASGKQTKSEIHGYGRHEFVPWHIGAVL